MIDQKEAEVKTRHKKRLDKIRAERASDGNRREDDRENTISAEYEDGSSNGTSQGTGNQTRNELDEPGERTERVQGQPGTIGRSDSGIRQANGSNIDATSGHDPLARGPEEDSIAPAPVEKDMEAEKARKRELDRQRKARARAAERTTRDNAAPNELKTDIGQDTRDGETVRELPRDLASSVQFKLKGPFAGRAPAPEEKPFTQKEADESLEKLTFIYSKGSEILDDILEIIVKDHEPVQIWALDNEEAEMLASMQLERAKKDKAAARTVRVLLRLYERVYLFLIVGPRVKATASHVKEHRGFSFR